MYKKLIFSILVIVFTLISSVNAKNIVWVAMNWDEDGDGVNDSQEWVDKLRDEGFTVDIQPGRYDALTSDLVGELNAADLVIVSGTIQSGTYTTNDAEAELWNSVTVPMLNCCPYVLRSTRWKWVNNGDSELPNNNGDQGSPLMQVLKPSHPIFYGIPLDSNNQVQVVDPDLGSGHATFIGTADAGNGTLLAKTVGNEWLWIVEWKTGVEFYNGSGAYATNHRMTFSIGAHEVSETLPARGYNFTDAGWKLFLNTVKYMLGESINPLNASSPDPANGETFVLNNAILSWTPGIYADTHNVYFGTDFNDVNDGTADVLLSEGQDANTFDPGLLELEQTYYWRIDEVNAPADPGINKGDIWSFTVEPLAYKVPSSSITASASSQESEDFDPENTINESGLDPNDMDLHSTLSTDMWLTDDANATDPAWIQYDFDKLYKLHQMLVWNYNGQFVLSGFGIQDVNIEYSENGQTWKQLSSATQFERAPGTVGYKYNTVVDFGDVSVKSVKINALNKWGGDIYPQYGLAEVRFLYIPVRARIPEPETDSNDIPIDVTLSWKAGREANNHIISLSTDQQAVANGDAIVETTNQMSYSPLSLNLGSTYYWRIDEVNDDATPTTWIGDIWNFNTQDYIVVEDFERYTDEEPDRIWDFWTDGWEDDNNGSTMGYSDPDFDAGEHFVETDNVYDGDQSAPIFYNNSSATYSEVSVNVSALPIGTNWSAGSPETLVLWFYGNVGNTPAKMYLKINNQSPEYYPGDISAVAQPMWKQWNIDITGYNLNSITSLVIGFERADTPGGESLVFVDEIRLYREAPPVATDEVWIEAESGVITEPLQIYDDAEDDPNASGLQYIGTVEGSGDSSTNPPTTGVATYTFDVDGGVYRVLFRVIIPAGGTSDSFWVSFTDATEVTPGTDPDNPGWINFNNIPVGNQWHMAEVTSDDHENQVINFTLPAGTNTMKIAYREDGARLDAILITNLVE